MESTMKNYLILSAVVLTASLGYATSQSELFLGFVNALGAFSIFFVIASGYVFLEQFGYFDVFGYTFKKTYLVLSNKHKDLEGDEKERMGSMYQYAQDKQRKRTKPTWMFYTFSFSLLAISALLSWIYLITR